MKRILTMLILGVALMGAACKKEEDHTQNLFIGADLKSQSWTAEASAGYITTDTLQLIGYRASGEQTLIINLKFKGTGTYTVTGVRQAKYFTTVGRDVLTSDYALDTSKTNTVVITDYALQTGVMKGSFMLNFVKVSSGAGDQTLNFTNGRFWIAAPIKP